MIKPKFIVIGGMKCGSSTLFSDISSHPNVYHVKNKEPMLIGESTFLTDSKLRERYESFFSKCPVGAISGDGSTHYSKYPEYPDSPKNAKQYLGEDVLIIYIVRNVFSRIESHFSHDKSAGLIPADMTISEAVRSYAPLIDCSLYGKQIKRWCDIYGKSRTICLSLGDYNSRREHWLNLIWKKLDLEEFKLPISEIQNSSEGRFAPRGYVRMLVNSYLYLRFVRPAIPKRVKIIGKKTFGVSVESFQEKLTFEDRRYVENRLAGDIDFFCSEFQVSRGDVLSDN